MFGSSYVGTWRWLERRARRTVLTELYSFLIIVTPLGLAVIHPQTLLLAIFFGALASRVGSEKRLKQ